jgi:LytR cell envelope-related transcriptional attenuator
MNERVPDSSGLPLRAMVMVLLFLGVIFLLVGFQAMSSSGNSDEDSSAVSNATTTSAPQNAKPAAGIKSDVRVYNVSGTEGVAGRTADKLRNAGYNVTDVGNLNMPNISATTVYFSDAAGEHETADAVGKLLAAPVAPRTSDIANQPPGVIVVVAG